MTGCRSDRKKPLPRSGRTPGLACTGCAYVLFMLVIVFVSPQLNRLFGILGVAASQVLLLVLALSVCAACRADFLEVFPMRPPGLVHTFGFLLLWAGTFLLTTVFSTVLAGYFPEAQHAAGQSQSFLRQSGLPCALAAAALLPALAEEAAFRGTLLSGLSARLPAAVSVVLSAALFSLAHVDPFRIAQTFLLGLSLGYAAIRTKSILAPVLMHLLNNVLVLTLLFYPSLSTRLNRMLTLHGRSDFYPLIAAGVLIFSGIILLKTDPAAKGDNNHGSTRKTFQDGPLL